MAIETEWTAELVLALPDDGVRRELLDGELVVMPAPSLLHQNVVGEFYDRLKTYVRKSAIGSAHMSPADIEFSSRRLVQPDVFVAPLVAGGKARSWTEIRALLLAIEVSSPSTARHDRIKKRHIYMSERVDEYWIVDLDARAVERWRHGEARPEVVDGTITWQSVASVPALTIDLEALFDAALS
ncbi:MAG: Uma2 family endonuclease [Gemmatimonadota bacterium]